ncbi:hypothetical protein [Geomesophilobacter sediminis]|uniref:Uncharacterized protein n=1 Tax=Geomesophilobacter sediminis TaxID=2798584 RepID=A0A8J7JCL1_9BACT|nr:hypothetical protein [Geomesophilobacter sediminis]MBJ6724598.1 hypothetical protein [Geomesophilobacter sediminis]
MEAIFGTALIAFTVMSIVAVSVQYLAYRNSEYHKASEERRNARRSVSWKGSVQPLV